MLVNDFLSVLSELNSASFSSLLSNGLVWLALGTVCLAGVVIYFVNQRKINLSPSITEQTQNFKNKIQSGTSDITGAAQEKINDILDEYKRILPYMEELGLSVEGFSIEAGLLPQIKTSLRGSIENIKDETVERIKLENNNNQLLVAVLNAVLMAKKCHLKLESVYISILKDIIIDVKLGIPPSISVRFQ